MKKSILLGSIIMFICFSNLLPVFAAEEADQKEETEKLELAPEAKSAILIERDSGKVLFKKNENKKLPPASMTKLMTLLLTMESLENGDLKIDEMVRISERAASMGGSQVFLEAGEEMSVEDLLKSIAIASGNDASVAIAERIAGSEEAFVKQMNEKVTELGLQNTNFKNSSGLPADGLYSTAHDMAIIAKELLKYEAITDYTSIYEDFLRKGQKNEFWLVNTNKLVKFYPGVDGLKTGYTSEAKYSLTATAKKNDMRVVAVVMGAETVKKRNAMISTMLDYAFNHYQTKNLFEKNQIVTNLKLIKAETENIDIVTSESISTIHQKGESTENVKTEILLNEEFNLPMKKGDQVGQLIIKDKDKIISRSPLVVKHDVYKASYLTLFKRSLKSLAKNL